MRTLLVSPFPPTRDGLATYASQLYATWTREGRSVEVLSPEPSAARFNAELKTPAGILRTLRLARRFDQMVVQFHPETFFYGMDLLHFLQGWVGLMALFTFAPHVEVVVHETPHKGAGRLDGLRSVLWGVLWRRPETVSVHTEAERKAMADEYSLDPESLTVIDHGAGFTRHSNATRSEARASLGVEPDEFLFLCAGFIQPHKGFDRAARALGCLKGDDLRLAIVGEMRVWTPEHQAYLDLLRKLAESDPRVTLHDGYVSDETFDRWIIASDVVVLPYRHIWSSGVAERADLYGRPVIATDVGGLAEQVSSSSRVVSDREELIRAMAQVCGAVVDSVDVASDSVPRGRTRAAGSSGASRADLQRLVSERAAVLHEWYDPLERSERPILGVAVSDPLDGPLALPAGRGGMGPKAVAQRVVSRLIDWRVVPIALYVNAMREQLLGDPSLKSELPGVPTGADTSPRTSSRRRTEGFPDALSTEEATSEAGNGTDAGVPFRKTSKQPGRRRPSSGSTPQR